MVETQETQLKEIPLTKAVLKEIDRLYKTDQYNGQPVLAFESAWLNQHAQILVPSYYDSVRTEMFLLREQAENHNSVNIGRLCRFLSFIETNHLQQIKEKIKKWSEDEKFPSVKNRLYQLKRQQNEIKEQILKEHKTTTTEKMRELLDQFLSTEKEAGQLTPELQRLNELQASTKKSISFQEKLAIEEKLSCLKQFQHYTDLSKNRPLEKQIKESVGLVELAAVLAETSDIQGSKESFKGKEFAEQILNLFKQPPKELHNLEIEPTNFTRASGIRETVETHWKGYHLLRNKAQTLVSIKYKLRTS